MRGRLRLLVRDLERRNKRDLDLLRDLERLADLEIYLIMVY